MASGEAEDSSTAKSLTNSEMYINHIRRSKRRRLLMTTFFGSGASLVFAIGYDYVRPRLIDELVPWLSKQLIFRKPREESLVSPQVFILVLEVLLVCPMVLALLPCSRIWEPKPSRRSNALRHVLQILERVALGLWTIAAVLLVMGVLYRKVFGVISFSALLAFFAQGIQAVKLLGSHHSDVDAYDSDELTDDFTKSLNPSQSLKQLTKRRKRAPRQTASSWTHSKKRASKETTRKTPSKVSIETKVQAEKLDVMIFFLVSSCLLLSPYYLHIFLKFIFKACLGCVHRGTDLASTLENVGVNSTLFQHLDSNRPGEWLAATAFCTTILIPIMTHGVGGAYFVGKEWDFYHPFRGGTHHITTQALGWSFLFVAGLLQLLFLTTNYDYSLYLWHGGSWLSMIAHGSLLGSILLFRQDTTLVVLDEVSLDTSAHITTRSFKWLILSVIQDIILTNMHWFFAYWLTSAGLGFDAFSLDPTANLFNIPFHVGLMNMIKLVSVWYLWTWLVPFSAKRKRWRYNLFGKINDCFEWALFHRQGLFHASQLKFEEPSLDSYHKEPTIFCILPHGTLPTSVLAVWHQFDHFFDDVCCFFGSQVALVPGYRYILAMRGGFMPVNKPELIRVMRTNQSVSLVPGGISEMMHCDPHSSQINVSIKHKGFIKLALQHGYDLVPLFFFHANDQYDNPLKSLQAWTYHLFGIPVGLPWYTNKYRLPVSNRTPIQCVLGKRIIIEKPIAEPTNERIDQVHRLFYEEVYRVFEAHKHDFGYGDRELTYVS